MRIPIAVVGHATNRAEIQAFADATCLVNRVMLRERGTFAPLYSAGIRYRPERRGGKAPGVERFQTIDSSYELGFDDCDGLAPARAAELLNQGIWARPWVVRSRSVGWHVVVLRKREDGTFYVEDPSARLGMLDDSQEREEVEGMPVRFVARVHRRGQYVIAAVGAVTEEHQFGAMARALVDEGDAQPERKAKKRAVLRALRGLGRATAKIAVGPQARIIEESVKLAAKAVNEKARVEHDRIAGVRRLRA